MMGFINEWQEKLGVKITCSQETEPMGTAGPLALARSILDDGSGNPFFVLNSDVICEYPLAAMLDFHAARGAEATILVTKVEDPTKVRRGERQQSPPLPRPINSFLFSFYLWLTVWGCSDGYNRPSGEVC